MHIAVMHKVFNPVTMEFDYLPDEPIKTLPDNEDHKPIPLEVLKQAAKSIPPELLGNPKVYVATGKQTCLVANPRANTDARRAREYRLRKGDDYRKAHAAYMKQRRATEAKS